MFTKPVFTLFYQFTEKKMEIISSILKQTIILY